MAYHNNEKMPILCFTQSTYTKMEECGHYPMLEKPKEWATAVMDFILKIENKN